MPGAFVVGSGPNGLAGAVRLAEAGLEVTVLEAADRVGGGTRTSELTLPGVLHDECSAFHPFGAASPYLRRLGLERHGLRFRYPEIQLAHPLADGRAAVLVRSVQETAQRLGDPGWSRVFEPLTRDFDALVEEVFRPVLHVPRRPLALARFGVGALLPAPALSRVFSTVEGRALFGGVAAHLIGRLNRPLASSVGLLMTAAGHRRGWPVAEGGSQAIADALVRRLQELGGRVETGVRVTHHDQLAGADVVLHDTTPPAVLALLGDRLPTHVRRAYGRYRFGPGAFKLDLAVREGIPWTNPDLARAGTIHLGGTLEDIAGAEAAVVTGRMPARPFVLLGQQYVADPGRSQDDVHPVWAYAHVPSGWRGDATEHILAQIEEHAPGVRGRIVASTVRGPVAMSEYNTNYVGGDIAAGANSPLQVAMRPRVAVNPYRTGVAGHYLCSAATPPGAGVHGMGGFNAAETALADLTDR